MYEPIYTVAYVNLPLLKEHSSDEILEYDNTDTEYDDIMDIKYTVQVNLIHDDNDENSYFNSDRHKMNQEMSSLNKEYKSIFEKHIHLQEEIGQTYSVAINYTGLDSKEMLLCVQKCNEDFEIIPDILEFYRKQKLIYNKYGIERADYNACPHSVRRMLIIMEKMGKYDEALDLCQWALDHGLTRDGTEGGIIGRMARIAKKKNKKTK